MTSPCAGKRLSKTDCTKRPRSLKCQYATGPRRSFCRKITQKRLKERAALRIQSQSQQKSESRRRYRMLQRRIRPFVPEFDLRTKLLRIGELDLEQGFHNHLGFKERSKQWNFLTSFHPSRFVLLLMRRGDDTFSPTSEKTIAVAFGEYNGRSVDLWHVSVNRTHPLNDSRNGERWGVYGIKRVVEKSRIRWINSDGRKITAANHVQFIKGTPNPYAVLVVSGVVDHFLQTFRKFSRNPTCPALKCSTKTMITAHILPFR